MMQIETPKWYFVIGSAEVEFPLQDASIEENRTILMPRFPQLCWTSIIPSDAEFSSGKMLVKVILPPVKTNG